jgi:NAD+ diphosphatase
MPPRRNTPDPFTAPLAIPSVGFTGASLDRADHLRSDTAALDALRAGSTARFVAFTDLRPIVDLSSGQPDLLWLTASEIPAASPWVFLGFRDAEACFAVSIPADVPLPGEPIELRAAAAGMTHGDAAILSQARALLSWHQYHSHCSVCGADTRPAKGGYQRICESAACQAQHFPRTDPVVIMLVIDGSRCLLGRQPKFPPGFYSSLAGFVEPGESIEEAVAREVFEESGIRVGRVRYVASQPWPFPSSLMIGCFAEAATTEIKIDSTELEDARWFTKADVRAALAGSGPFNCPPPFAIAHNLLQAWAAL